MAGVNGILFSVVVVIFVHSVIGQTTESSADNSNSCLCSCVRKEIPETPEEVEEFVEKETEKIEKELYVDTQTLSSTVRKKESATDERPSAQNMGYLGISMLCLAGGIVLVMDADYVFKMVSHIKSLSNRGHTHQQIEAQL